MADVKISQLPVAGILTGAELVPIVQGGVTKRALVSDIGVGGGPGVFSVTSHPSYVRPTTGTPLPDNTVALQATIDTASAWAKANDPRASYYAGYAKADVAWATVGYFNDALMTGTYAAMENTDWQTPVIGQRVLVKDHETPTKNGIYIVNAGAWTRATDADEDSEFWVGGTNVLVTNGHYFASTRFRIADGGSVGAVVVGSSPLKWSAVPMTVRASVVDEGLTLAVSSTISVKEGVDLMLSGPLCAVPGTAQLEELLVFRQNSRNAAPLTVSGRDGDTLVHGGVRVVHYGPDQRMTFAPMSIQYVGQRGASARSWVAAPGASTRPIYGLLVKGWPFQMQGVWVVGADVGFRIESSDIDAPACYALASGEGGWLATGNSYIGLTCDFITGAANVPVKIDASAGSRIDLTMLACPGVTTLVETGTLIGQSWATSTGLEINLNGVTDATRAIDAKYLGGPTRITAQLDGFTGTAVRWGTDCSNKVLVDAVLEDTATPVAFASGITTGGLIRYVKSGAQMAAKADGTLVTVVPA